MITRPFRNGGKRKAVFNAAGISTFILIESNADIRLYDVPATGSTPALKRFNFKAYTGGAVKLPNLDCPVVFDLATLRQAPNIPLLYSHKATDIVGHTDSVQITAREINASGLISGTGEKAREVLELNGRGFPWQVSVGLISDNIVFYRKGETFTANGQSFTGPKYFARDGLLREISFVPTGADANTSAILAATFTTGDAMKTFLEWLASMKMDHDKMTEAERATAKRMYDGYVSEYNTNHPTPTPTPTPTPVPAPAPVATVPAPVPTTRPYGEPAPIPDVAVAMRATAVAEETRIDSIRRLRDRYSNPSHEGRSIYLTAMADGWDVNRTELEMMRAARPTEIHAGGRGSTGDAADTSVLLECALAQSGKLGDTELARRFTPQQLERAHTRYRSRMGLQELFLEAAFAGGYSGSRNFKSNLREILQAAFSTINIPGILSNNTNKFLMAGFMAVDDAWRKIATIGRVSDFKEIANYRGVGAFRLERIGPDGLIPHGSISEVGYGNKADTHAKMLAITRTDFINDDLGVITQVPRMLGRGAGVTVNRAFWTEFLENASNFWHANNANVSSGALSIAGLNAANAVLQAQRDEEGEFLMAQGRYVVVPNALEPTALQLFRDTTVVSGSTTPLPNSNTVAGKFEPVTSPYLTDTTITGNSAVAYYLLADPNDIPTIEIVFLDGVETPTVETAEVDFNRLGVQMRAYFDFGVRKQEPKGSVRSTGV